MKLTVKGGIDIAALVAHPDCPPVLSSAMIGDAGGKNLFITPLGMPDDKLRESIRKITEIAGKL